MRALVTLAGLVLGVSPLLGADAAPATELATLRFETGGFEGNGKLDENFLGVPSEPLCFSRGASGSMGPPDFAAAAVEVEAGVVKTACEL